MWLNFAIAAVLLVITVIAMYQEVAIQFGTFGRSNTAIALIV